MGSEQPHERPGTDYPAGQMAKAFVTALSHADPEVRANAERRVSKWRAVIDGITSGRVQVGSRTPVAGLPAWVTPEVVRGGFATGDAAAGGPLSDDEADAAARLGAARHRRDLFAAALSEAGLAHLTELLESGHYRVTVPEEAVLVTVAWLVNQGDIDGALSLVEAVAPHAAQLRFWPRRGGPPFDLNLVSRATVAETRSALARREPNRRVETMREALTVWNPFTDELVAFWQRAATEAVAPAPPADEARPPRQGSAELGVLQAEARTLHQRYLQLAAAHTLCTKHRKPKENLGALVGGLEAFAATGAVPPRVAHAVESVVRRRGDVGSPEHTELRRVQAHNAAVPGHHRLAQVVIERLAQHPLEAGLTDLAPLTVAVTEPEAAATQVPVGAALPASVLATLQRALEAPVDRLIPNVSTQATRGAPAEAQAPSDRRGTSEPTDGFPLHQLVPSAEVLAQLVPRIAAATTAAEYPDEASQWLAAQTYLAFRNRRSLLLVDLNRQVQIEELPWVTALARHRDAASAAPAQAAVTRLAELTIVGFPATTVPNPMLREIDTLARAAGLQVPIVEELAADIFMGTFSPKYLRAAQVAAELLTDTLYARYYDIGYCAVAALASPSAHGRPNRSDPFAALCAARAGAGASPDWSVARNGTIIEQAQILTTQNLATLVGPIGLGATLDGQWAGLARRCFDTVISLVGRVHNNPRPLSAVKDAAYAWRHMVFFLSFLPPDQQRDETREAIRRLATEPGHVRARVGPALTGLRHLVDGGAWDDVTCPPQARRFLGWATDGHWMVTRTNSPRPPGA